MNPLQNTIDNNVHESNIAGFVDNNFLQPTAATATQAGYSSNSNCNDTFCNCNNDIGMMNNDTFPARTTDYNNIQQSYTSSNNGIISPDYNYQQPIFGYASNNNVIDHSDYHQTTPNNVSPHFFPQFNDQNSSNTNNVFPLLNSLGITIYSPQTNIIIVPVTSPADIRNIIQQDRAYSNNSS